MKKTVSTRLPDFTIEQINMLKRFYEVDDPANERFSTSRIIIICINKFWEHIFVDTYNSNDGLDNIREFVMQEFNK